MTMRTTTHWASLALCLLLTSQLAEAQPAPWLQGIWNGTCTRGNKTANASLILAYSTTGRAISGTLNGNQLAEIRVDRQTIYFLEGQKTFDGVFSPDFDRLSAEIGKGSKSPARCSNLTRAPKESDQLCLLGGTKDLFVWLDSHNGQGGNSTFILPAGQPRNIAGDKSGRLCFNGTDFKPPLCPVEIPQKYYACR